MVGSLRKDKPYVPLLFKRTLVKATCQFAYQNNKTLVYYKSENDKMILLVSSFRRQNK